MQRVKNRIKKIFYNREFCEARIIVYTALAVAYIVVAYLIKIQCVGCPLCGMTRAVKCLLTLRFEDAFNYNNLIWCFCIIIPLILIDILCMAYLNLHKILIMKEIKKSSVTKNIRQ